MGVIWAYLPDMVPQQLEIKLRSLVARADRLQKSIIHHGPWHQDRFNLQVRLKSHHDIEKGSSTNVSNISS